MLFFLFKSIFTSWLKVSSSSSDMYPTWLHKQLVFPITLLIFLWECPYIQYFAPHFFIKSVKSTVKASLTSEPWNSFATNKELGIWCVTTIFVLALLSFNDFLTKSKHLLCSLLPTWLKIYSNFFIQGTDLDFFSGPFFHTHPWRQY